MGTTHKPKYVSSITPVCSLLKILLYILQLFYKYNSFDILRIQRQLTY